MIIASESSKDIAEKLEKILIECKKNLKHPIIIVDELDVLVRESREETMKRLFDVITVIIEKYEKMSSNGLAPLFLLVTSPRVRDFIITSKDLSSRLHGRIVSTEYVGRLFKEPNDVMKAIVMGAVIGLCRYSELLKKEIIKANLMEITRLLYLFAMDAKEALIEKFNNDPEAIPIREAIRMGLYFSIRILIQALRKSNIKELLKIIELRGTERGKLIEDVLLKLLRTKLSSFEIEVKSPHRKEFIRLIITMLDERETLSGLQCDFKFGIRIGYTYIGKIIVEITSERELSTQKKKQLLSFLKESNCLLIYAYQDNEAKSAFIDSISQFIQEENPEHILERILIPGYFVRYASLAYILYEDNPEKGLEQWFEIIYKAFKESLLEAIKKLATNAYDSYLLAKPVIISPIKKIAKESERVTLIDEIDQRVSAFSRSLINKWTQNGQKKRTSVDKTLHLFENNVSLLLDSLSISNKLGDRKKEFVFRICKDIIIKLRSANLIRWAKKYHRLEELLEIPGAKIMSLDKLYSQRDKALEIIKEVVLTNIRPLLF